LDIQVANLIAAGEVVDRPASACKELLENAIDAGGSVITVEIKKGGISFIRVSDNGRGMAREDVPIAIRRHATSKIKDASDLDAIGTLGFRGEALAAIASVSHLRILTKRREDAIGTQLECEPGREPTLTDVGCSDGTTVIAEELFSNVPARRKFLKKDQTESMAVTASIEKVALSHPEIAIRLIIDGQTRFSTAGDGQLKNTIYALLGRDFAMRLIEVSRAPGESGIGVTGYIGSPDNVRANRGCQNFFINGRYVKSKCAQAALEQAFTSFCPAEKFPVCVLNITLPPEAVDVNVHPAKLEVKFANEKAVFEAVYYAVRGGLEQKIPRPQLKIDTRGKDASQISYEMMKTLNAFVPLPDRSEREPSPKSPYNNLRNVGRAQMSIGDMPDATPPAEVPPSEPEQLPLANAIPNPPPPPEPPEELPPSVKRVMASSAPAETDGDNSPLDLDALAEARRFRDSLKPVQSPQPVQPPRPVQTSQPFARMIDDMPLPPEIEAIQPHPSRRQLEEDAKRMQPPPQAAPEPTSPAIPAFRIIGEAFYSYVFVEVGDKVLIIDKHAAHERILFEDLKKSLSTKVVASQMLLLPLEVPLTPEQMAAADDFDTDIRALGFDYHKKDERTLAITAIPSAIDAASASDMMETITERLATGTGIASISRNILFEKALYQASCKAAIKIGRIEDIAHIRWIVEKLLSLPDIKFCPHGRPVAFELSKANIERQFGRT
ncbi:MAG: DNA mismatch repair endonuclease MutL, partial [Clostridia bacterium]|nr:DNA mismatch repair endonuclease MutL [Clostridia bacterium]